MGMILLSYTAKELREELQMREILGGFYRASLKSYSDEDIREAIMMIEN